MKLQLMFHDDWEIWGDGSGDCEELMFAPARKILDLCDRVGARYTFFAEVGQQLAMKASSLASHQSTAKEWETILKDAIRRGHDVQLHLHPQWIGARWENDRWALNISKFSTARLDPVELKEWLKRGMEYLRDLLKGRAPDYDVVAFRGGGFMIQPSNHIISVLKELGIRADVTVIKGLRMLNETMGDIDFSHAPSSNEPWFPDPNDLARPSSVYRNLFCLPVYSFQTKLPLPLYSILHHPGSVVFSVGQYLHAKQQTYIPVYFRGQKQVPSGGPTTSRFKRIFKSRTLFLDFGMMHHSLILNKVQSILEQGESKNLDSLPMILYTHSKTFSSYQNFETLLNRLSANKNIVFETTRRVVNTYHEKMPQYKS